MKKSYSYLISMYRKGKHYEGRIESDLDYPRSTLAFGALKTDVRLKRREGFLPGHKRIKAAVLEGSNPIAAYSGSVSNFLRVGPLMLPK